MTLWTVMFGDNPLAHIDPGRSRTKPAAHVKIFISREKAYEFRDLCLAHGVHADVAPHPYKGEPTAFH